MTEHVHISSSRSLMIAAAGFAVWAIGYVAIALPFHTGAREWGLCVLGPLILSVGVLTHGSAFRKQFGSPAHVIAAVGCVLAARRSSAAHHSS
jgi:hypothetical protein